MSESTVANARSRRWLVAVGACGLWCAVWCSTTRAQTPGGASALSPFVEPAAAVPSTQKMPFAPADVGHPVALAQEKLPEGPQPKPLPKQPSPLERVVDLDAKIDLVVGIPRLLILKETPKRVQIGGEKASALATVMIVSEKEISLLPSKAGRTTLNLWFADPKDATRERVYSFLLNILPDDEVHKTAQERLASYVKGLEAQVNQAFPDSRIHLLVVGTSLIVSGQARDAAEGAQILSILNPRRAAQRTGTTTVVQHGLDQSKIEKLEPPEPADDAPKSLIPESYEGIPGLYRTLNIVNQVRIPGEQQVMLKVVVAEVNRSALRALGVNFTISNAQGLVFANTTGGIIPTLNSSSAGGTSVTASTAANLSALLNNGKIIAAIEALKQTNLARSIAEPNIVALNGQTGGFHAGGEFPVPIVTGFTAAGLQGVSFVPFGVDVNFTPYITDKDRVRLTVKAEVSTRDNANSASVGGTNVPSLNTRKFHSVVELRQGDTLAVAGLIQQNYAADAQRVPFFGDLPVLGRLFGRQHNSAGEQELIVLITPVLVHPLDCKSWRPLPGGDMFEPNEKEFYLHGRLESNHPVDFRSPIRSDLKRTAEYRDFSQPSIVPPYQGNVPTSPYSTGGLATPAPVSAPTNSPPSAPPTLWQRLWH